VRAGVRLAIAAGAIGSAAALLAAGLATGRTPAHEAAAIRTVEVTMHFSRFEPSAIWATPGETVRLVIRNTDPIDHEFILGDRGVQRVHELGTEAVHPPKRGEVSVPAGATAETTYTFGDAGTLTFGCHVPGHYAYGMRGKVRVA
jgi:uncharacterized cupredoxin-like copper-binding protein